MSCAENHYKCLLTGGRTIALIQDIVKHQQALGYQVEFAEESDYLQPQTIYIHADKRSVFVALAQKCKLLYQDNIYANTIKQYLEYEIKQTLKLPFYSKISGNKDKTINRTYRSALSQEIYCLPKASPMVIPPKTMQIKD